MFRTTKITLGFAVLFLAALGSDVRAQANEEATPPEANPADVASVDAIIATLYDVISGPAGEARDWDRFLSLFKPDARLIPSGRNPATGVGGLRYITPDGYVTLGTRMFATDGFFEVEVNRVSDEFGQIMHVFSTYESRKAEDAEPFDRGINSIQLLNDGTRWWVVNIFWLAETDEWPIPAKYLPGS